MSQLFKEGDRVKHKTGDEKCRIPKGLAGTVEYTLAKHSTEIEPLTLASGQGTVPVKRGLWPPENRIGIRFDGAEGMLWHGAERDYEPE